MSVALRSVALRNVALRSAGTLISLKLANDEFFCKPLYVSKTIYVRLLINVMNLMNKGFFKTFKTLVDQ